MQARGAGRRGPEPRSALKRGDALATAGSEIIVCGKRFEIEHPVCTFEDTEGFSAYVPHRTDDTSQIYASHPAPGLAGRAERYRQRRLLGGSSRIEHLRQLVGQITVHLDGCDSAARCFDVLHNQRGLSVHFMVDNDGTIYQTLDVLHCAFHAAGVNEVAVGIELQNRGDAARHPNLYGGRRETVTCWVHGAQFLCYAFTDAQYQAMSKLSRALARILDVPLTSPRHDRELVWTRLPDPRTFKGFLGHYHVSLNKWDPGPFDFQRLFQGLSARVTYPLSPPRERAEPVEGAGTESQTYYENSELDADAHFPVGPLGRSHLWHGGVHLRAREGAPVFAIASGRIVAARDAACPIGSCSFVLLQHDLRVGARQVSFYSLFYHLAGNDPGRELAAGASEPRWLEAARQDERSWTALQRGEVALLSVEVEAGELVGHVGRAGPPRHRSPQIHFAVFSPTEVGAPVDPGHWHLLDGGERDRLCRDPWLLRRIDRARGGSPPDGKLTRRELRNFFQLNPRREELRRLVVRHRSEWTPGDWPRALAEAPDFASLGPAERRRLIAEQIEPTLFWTPDFARQLDLPASGVIYSYHPIGFVSWLSRLQREEVEIATRGIAGADAWEGQQAPEHLTVDAEAADAMTDHEDYYSGAAGKGLELEDLIKGYQD